MVCSRLPIVITCIAWMLLEIFAYPRVAVVHFTYRNWISKTVYCIRCVMVCEIFSCSESPDIPEKLRRWRKPANTKRLAFQGNAKRGLAWVFRVHNSQTFSIKMPLIWYSINWPSLITDFLSFSRFKTICFLCF